MTLLRKAILWTVLIILFEASVRKYILASPVLVLLKYIALVPLFVYAFKGPSARYSIALFAITLPLLATIPEPAFIPYAVYDLISIFYLPVILFCLSIARRIFPFQAARDLLRLIALIGFLNSILIILQSLVGPQHWLSQTVDQSFSIHAFGEALKAPGLAGTSSPYMSIAGLIALDVLLRAPISRREKRLIPFSQLLIAISVVFNLASRTYTFGILGYVLPRLLIPSLINKRFEKSALIFLLLPLAYYFFQSVAPELGLSIFKANRAVDDFSSASGRFYTIPLLSLLLINPFALPFVDGLGLGYAVNNNPLADISYTPHFCMVIGLGSEHEYERFICSFGAIGFLHILSRLVLAVISIRNALYYSNPRFPASIASGWLFFTLTLANGLLLRSNDTATGALLLLITLSASQSLLASREDERMHHAHHELSFPAT
jgi:hypothetical protein